MDSNTEIVENLVDKVNKLISLYEQEVSKNKMLEGKCLTMECEVLELTNKVSELEIKNQKLQLVSAFKVTSKDKHAAKAKINKIVREIDKCVALLNR